MSAPLRIAFLGCGFITRVHSRHLRWLRSDFACAYASREPGKAEAFRQRYGGIAAFADYHRAIEDPRIDAIVVTVPPHLHLDLTLHALQAGKHVLVEKPAFPRLADFDRAIQARTRAGRVVIVGENDHYKPLAVCLRRLLAKGMVGDLVFSHVVSIAKRLKSADDWRNDESMAGGDAFFEEGIHWLHLAGSLGPRIARIHGLRQLQSHEGPDRRAKSMLVAFQYDTGAVGSVYYSREIPSLLKGLRMSKLFGRRGVITFESNGLVVLVRGVGLPRVIVPGLVDLRGYRAMYRDFAASIREGRQPEMSLERAMDDHRLMEQVYAAADETVAPAAAR